MALNPTSFTSYSNSLLPNTSGQGVMGQNAMPASTSENNASNSLPTSELTTVSANPSPSTPNQTMLIIGGILSTLLAGGLLFWQRQNIASLLGKSSKSVPAPPQADTFINQAVAPVTTATQHTPKGKAIGERVGAVASGAKEKAGQAVSFLGNGVAMLPEVFGLLGDRLGSVRRGCGKTLKCAINMPFNIVDAVQNRGSIRIRPKARLRLAVMRFNQWRKSP